VDYTEPNHFDTVANLVKRESKRRWVFRNRS